MVLRLTETLDLPLRERNELLRAAGFSPAFPERGLDEPEMAPVRGIVDQMLRNHNPYPAFLLDRLWNLLDANETARKIFPMPVGDEAANAVELFLGPGAFRDMVENWSEVAWATLTRLRREVVAAGHDSELAGVLARGEDYLRDVPAPEGFDSNSPVIAPRLHLGDQTLSTVSAIAHFTAARDVTLEELRVELVFPADSTAEGFFEALSAS